MDLLCAGRADRGEADRYGSLEGETKQRADVLPAGAGTLPCKRDPTFLKVGSCLYDQLTSVKDVAVAAIDKLRRHGWLYDGSLKGVNLGEADLRGSAAIDPRRPGSSQPRAIACEEIHTTLE